MTDYLAEYTEYLAVERCSSANTIASYARDVSQFLAFLRENSNEDPLACQQETIEHYVEYMTGKGKSSASIARCLASLKSFFGFLTDKGLILSNPARNATPVKAERKYPQILTGKEVELFLEQPQCVDAKGYRDHAMLELLYATGIRVSELI